MALKKDPVFRKALVPWYDSRPVCVILIVVMALVFSFCLMGIDVSMDNSRYNAYVWMPVFLLILSAVVFLTAAARLLRRFWARRQD